MTEQPEQITIEQIDQMIAQICEWLKANSQVSKGKRDGLYAEEVRGYCYDMLDAANAYDAGGCPLCWGQENN